MKGVVVDVRASVAGDRLRVGAQVSTKQKGLIDAMLPDREVAAFLPRSLLLGGGTEAPRSLLASLTPILRRFTVGRDVRVWSHEQARYFSFPSWRSVRFRAEDHGVPLEAESAGGAGARPQGLSGQDASTTPA